MMKFTKYINIIISNFNNIFTLQLKIINLLKLVNKPGVAPPLRFDPGAGGLFMTSLIRRQLSSSLSVFGSYRYNK